MIKYKLEIYEDTTGEVLEVMDTADFDNLNIARRHHEQTEHQTEE